MSACEDGQTRTLVLSTLQACVLLCVDEAFSITVEEVREGERAACI